MTIEDGFDWDHLRYFLAVARTGRLTAAARRLRQDHTTVSRRIAALERALATPLFERSPQGYDLTSAGRRLLVTAEAMERTALAAHKEIQADGPLVSGTVRIGAPDGFGSYFMAPRIGGLIREHSELRPELVTMPRVFSLSKREADIAISLSRPTEGRLYARKLVDYRLGIFATSGYLAGQPPIAVPDDLKAQVLIGYVEDFIFTPELDYLPLIAPGVVPQFRSSTLVAQLQATLSGAGLCVLPCFMAASHAELVPVLAEISIVRTFWLITHADLHDLPRIRATSDFIAREARAARALFLPGE